MSGAQRPHAAQHLHDRPLLGIACKVMACLLFAVMFASIRWLGPYFPLGEIVFFRSTLGIPVIVAMALATGGPALLTTKRVDSHALRSLAGTISMFCNFAAYTFLPLADATAIGFAQRGAKVFVVDVVREEYNFDLAGRLTITPDAYASTLAGDRKSTR